MRWHGVIIAAILLASGAGVMVAYSESPALVAQPEFFNLATDGVASGARVVQTFRASGTATGARVICSNFDHSGVLRHVTCSLFEIHGNGGPADWSETVLVSDTVPVARSTMRGPLSFDFEPTRLDPRKRYGLRFESDFAPHKFVLMRDASPSFEPGPLFQGDKALSGALAFRIDGQRSAAGLLGAMRDGRVRPPVDPDLVAALLAALLTVGGLIAGAAPGSAARRGLGTSPRAR